MDLFFQKVCDFFPAYSLNSKIKKKIFYIFFSLLKSFLNGPFLMNFGNFKIFAYPQKKDYTRYLLTRCELPDPSERNIIFKNLNNKNNIFIDCGANVGFYTLDIATKIPNIKVYSFEPSVKEVFYLKKNLKLNNLKNVQVIEMAVGDTSGSIVFNDTRNENLIKSGGGFVSKKKSLNLENYEVKITSLDDFFKIIKIEKNSSIFIKTDLEGYDLNAIKGAFNLLTNYDCTVIFEFSKMILEQQDYNLNNLKMFASYDFKLYDIFGNEVEIDDLEKKVAMLDKKHETCGNFILSKKKLNFNS